MPSKQKTRRGTEVSVTTLKYQGPVRPIVQDRTYTVALSTSPLSVITTAGGSIGLTINTSTVSTAIDWGSTQSVWGEYRILGIKVEYIPLIPYAGGIAGVGFVAPLHIAGLSAPAGAGDMVNVPGRKYVSLGMPFSSEWKMSGSDEAGFGSTGSVLNKGGVNIWVQNAPATTTMGYYVATYLVQFRNQL